MSEPNAVSDEASELVKREILYEEATEAIKGARTIDDVKSNIDLVLKQMEKRFECSITEGKKTELYERWLDKKESIELIQDNLEGLQALEDITDQEISKDVECVQPFKAYFAEGMNSPAFRHMFRAGATPPAQAAADAVATYATTEHITHNTALTRVCKKAGEQFSSLVGQHAAIYSIYKKICDN